jgi:hypothetical protein
MICNRYFCSGEEYPRISGFSVNNDAVGAVAIDACDGPAVFVLCAKTSALHEPIVNVELLAWELWLMCSWMWDARLALLCGIEGSLSHLSMNAGATFVETVAFELRYVVNMKV